MRSNSDLARAAPIPPCLSISFGSDNSSRRATADATLPFVRYLSATAGAKNVRGLQAADANIEKRLHPSGPYINATEQDKRSDN
jgi:hypothetical protein